MRKKTKRIKLKKIKKVYNVDSCEVWLKDNFFDLNWVEIRLLPDAASFGSIKGWTVPREMSLTHVFHLCPQSCVSAVVSWNITCFIPIRKDRQHWRVCHKILIFTVRPAQPSVRGKILMSNVLFFNSLLSSIIWIISFFCDNYSRFYRCSQRAKFVI